MSCIAKTKTLLFDSAIWEEDKKVTKSSNILPSLHQWVIVIQTWEANTYRT